MNWQLHKAWLDENYSENQNKDKHKNVSDLDFAVVASFGHFIPKSVLSKFNQGGLNVHGSLLPAYRGSTPLQRAILEHEPFTGVTLQKIDENKLDHGDIVLQSGNILLTEDTTVDKLYQDASTAGGELLIKFFDDPDSCLSKKVVQPKKSPTKFAKLFKKEENWDLINFYELSARDIYARFRVFKELKLSFRTGTKSDIKNVRVTQMKLITTPKEFVHLKKGALFSKQTNLGPKNKTIKAVVICDEQYSIQLIKLRIIKDDNSVVFCDSGVQIIRNLMPFELGVGGRHSRYFSKDHFEHIGVFSDEQEVDERRKYLDIKVDNYYFL